jgi:hypothetical protein
MGRMSWFYTHNMRMTLRRRPVNTKILIARWSMALLMLPVIAQGQVTSSDSLAKVVERGDLSALRLRLSSGANPNEADNSSIKGWTPLMEAAFTGNIEAARLLLDAGAEIDAKTQFGKTALDVALGGTKPELAALLQSHGATRGKRAVPSIVGPTSLSGAWAFSWTTVFKEAGGQTGYSVNGRGWIFDASGNKWGKWGLNGGALIEREKVAVTPGGSSETKYEVGMTNLNLCGGHAEFEWTGQDGEGNSVYLSERVRFNCPPH